MSNMIDLPTYNESNWSFISRGEGSTSPVFSDEGIITTGKYTAHTYKGTALNKNKKYIIYFYQPRISNALYVGLTRYTDTDKPSTNIPADSNHNGIIGINKAVIYYENGKWYIKINEYTGTGMVTTGEVYITLSTVNNNYATEIKVLAVTEEDRE